MSTSRKLIASQKKVVANLKKSKGNLVMKNEMGFLEGTFAVLLRQQHTIVCSFWKDLYYGQPKNLARAIFTAYSPC